MFLIFFQVPQQSCQSVPRQVEERICQTIPREQCQQVIFLFFIFLKSQFLLPFVYYYKF